MDCRHGMCHSTMKCTELAVGFSSSSLEPLQQTFNSFVPHNIVQQEQLMMS